MDVCRYQKKRTYYIPGCAVGWEEDDDDDVVVMSNEQEIFFSPADWTASRGAVIIWERATVDETVARLKKTWASTTFLLLHFTLFFFFFVCFYLCCHLISSPAVIRPVNAHSTDFSSSSFLFLGFPKRFSCIGKDVVIIPNESYSNILFFLKFTAEISKFRK